METLVEVFVRTFPLVAGFVVPATQLIKVSNLYMADATKKCSQCLAEIPKQARKCSHCGSKQPTSILVWLVVIVLGALFLIIGLYEPSEPIYTPTTTYTPPTTPRATETAPAESFIANHYIDPTEFRNGAVRQVNVWRSYEDRTKVGELLGTAEVELIEQDEENNYCNVKNEKVAGWISCDWLVEIE